jgi:serine/threonine protein kinase
MNNGDDNIPMGDEITAHYSSSTPVVTGAITGSAFGNPANRKAPSLVKGQLLTLKGNSYEVLENISQNTLEADIYKLKDKDDKISVVKLYHSYSDPNKEPNREVLNRIKEIEHPAIVKLFDFGVGSEKYLNQHCFEIAEFAEGGDMFTDRGILGQKMSLKAFKAKYSPEFVEKVIVPRLFAGIQKLHELNIVHCDLKPSNIFFQDKDQQNVVIGDFGSAKAPYIQLAENLLITKNLSGTSFFQPPEHANFVISFKTDYYSFGAILIQLLYPEQIGESEAYWKLDNLKFESYLTALTNNKLIIKFSEQSSYLRINDLIRGLVQLSTHSRFGAEEVKLWLEGKEIPIFNHQGIRLGEGILIQTAADFINYIEENDNLLDTFIKDTTTNSLVKQWLQSTYSKNKREQFERITLHVQPSGELYMRETLRRFFRPHLPIVVSNISFHLYSGDDLHEELKKCIQLIDRLWKLSGIEEIRFPLFQIDLCLFQLIEFNEAHNSKIIGKSLLEKMYASFGIMQNPNGPLLHQELDIKGDEKVLNLFYAFDKARGFRDEENNPLFELEEIACYFAQLPQRFEHPLLKVELQKFLEINGYHNIVTGNLSDFLLQSLKHRASNQINISRVSMSRTREYQIVYGYEKNLNHYLSQKGLVGYYSKKLTTSEVFVYSAKFYESTLTVFNRFVKELNNKHNLANLSKEHLELLQSYFIKCVIHEYFKLYTGQVIAMALLIPLSFFSFKLFKREFRIDHNWNINSSPSYIPFSAAQSSSYDSVVLKYYLVIQNANLREQDNKSATILTTIPKGEEIVVMDQGNSPWVFIEYKGYTGFISAKLIVFSKEERVLKLN